MATSSITKNFVVTKKKEVKKFIKAIKDYEPKLSKQSKTNTVYLETPEETANFMQKREKHLCGHE